MPRIKKTEATWIVRRGPRGVLSVYACITHVHRRVGDDSYKRTDAYVHSLDL